MIGALVQDVGSDVGECAARGRDICEVLRSSFGKCVGFYRITHKGRKITTLATSASYSLSRMD